MTELNKGNFEALLDVALAEMAHELANTDIDLTSISFAELDKIAIPRIIDKVLSEGYSLMDLTVMLMEYQMEVGRKMSNGTFVEVHIVDTSHLRTFFEKFEP